MTTLDYVINKYHLNPAEKFLEIPDTNREDLATLFAELNFTTGAEIGTYKGEYAEFLCQTIPHLKLFCVDPYLIYYGYMEYGDDHIPKSESEARKRLANYDVTFIKKFSLDAVKDFADNSLDFVYLDANHDFQHVAEDLAVWHRKVKPGGIVAGHDYIRQKHSLSMHVVQALNGFCDAYEISPLFLLGRQFPKLPSEKRDKFRSWFFIINA